LSTIARIISPRFANLNNLPDATRIPPRMNKIVAMRKYAPIATNGNGDPPPTALGLVPMALGGGLAGAGLIKGPRKSASGICPNAIASATSRTTIASNFVVLRCLAPTAVQT
ncbi:MAG TPA: hypothetical protein VED24_01085, partial [Candidatus Acidoferrum sp.]|nr:hypothetical protein [Candidatus Acidoferrum sp.]